MRDIVVLGIIFAAIPAALFRPYIGVLVWTWVSIMNPHKMTWGMAFDFPVAQAIAIPTLIGVFTAREQRQFPLNAVTITLIAFILWMCLTSVFAIYPDETDGFSRAMKIQLMILVTLLLMRGRERIEQLLWVIVLSIGFFGAKGGIYTLLTGGGYGMVLGPPGGFFQENNALALVTIMAIPLMFYFYRESSRWWIKLGLIGVMFLCACTVLGTRSRGGLLAIAAMTLFFWLKSDKKLITFFLVLLAGIGSVALLPEDQFERVDSIVNYKQDSSAMGRINAWIMAWNLAKDRLLGGGFEIITPELFAKYAPDPLDVHAAHSIYFQVLGEHGFIGLGIFLLLWFLTWRHAAQVVRAAKGNPELAWAGRLASMVQVSLIGYFVGGAFLSLAYFDVPYNLMVVLVALHALVSRQPEAPAVAQPSQGPPQSSTAHG